MYIPSKLVGGGVPMGQTAGHMSTFRVRTKYPMVFKNDTPLDCFFDGVEEKLSLCLADQGEKATEEELQEGEEDILQDLKKAEDGFLEENTVNNRFKNGTVSYQRAQLYPAIWGEYLHSTSVFNGGELKHPSEKDAQELESKNLAYWGVIASGDPEEDMFFQQLEFDAQMPGRYAASMLEHNRKKTDRIIDHIHSKALFTSSGTLSHWSMKLFDLHIHARVCIFRFTFAFRYRFININSKIMINNSYNINNYSF